MTLRSGLNAQLGFAAETVFGTPVTVNNFVPLVSESVKRSEAFVESDSIIAGRTMRTENQRNGGPVSIEGDLALELMSHDMEILFRHMLGTQSGAGTLASPWVTTPGSLSGLGLTVQIGRPDIGGTVRAFTYGGVKIASWEIACAADEIATLGLSIVGTVEETTATSLATASFTSGIRPFKFNHGTVTVGGSAVNVKQITISGDNALDTGRRFLGTKLTAEPFQSDLRTITGSMQLEITDLTQYNRYIAQSSHAVVLTFTNGTQQIAITMNVRFDGETPNVGGRGIIEQPLPFTCFASGADSTAFSISHYES
jgi:hypothetical protein